MSLRITLLVMIAVALALSPALAQGMQRSPQSLPSSNVERAIITVDLLQPLGTETEQFGAAKSRVMGDMDALATELGKAQHRPGQVEGLFRRLDLSLDILGDEAGYTGPYICRTQGVRSIESYRVLRRYVDRLREQYVNASTSRQFYCAPRRYRHRSVA